MEIPQSYIIDKFYLYSTKVTESQSYLNGCCPICREGKSWGKKKRLFYFKNDDYLYCHNCGLGWEPFFWIKEASGMTFRDIKEELNSQGYDSNFKLIFDTISEKHFELPSLPGECVNLKDPLQLKHFQQYPIIQNALDYCKSRRLFTAINAPKTFYCCLNDRIHRNRLIIPFYKNNKIQCYISRKLLQCDEKEKYLLKSGEKKPVFNLDNVDENFPYIFIFEGQIDCMFIKNGIAVSGIHLTDEQEDILLREFPFHNIVWVLDNFRFEQEEVRNEIIKKLKKGESLFLYNGEFETFKDLNEYCVKKERDFVDPALILDGSFSGEKGLMVLGN